MSSYKFSTTNGFFSLILNELIVLVISMQMNFGLFTYIMFLGSVMHGVSDG